MIWSDFASFLQMGGHGAYVWASVAAVVLMMAGEMTALAVRERDDEARSRGEADTREPR